MIEVFITDIKIPSQAIKMTNRLENAFSDLNINFDLDETDFSFPQGHTVLRVEGPVIQKDAIIAMVNQSDFQCEIMKE